MKESTEKNLKNTMLIIVQTLILVGITVLAVLPFSCKVTTEGIEIIGGSYTAPVIETVKAVDEKTVFIDFSEAVKLRSVIVSPFIPGISDSLAHSATKNLSPAIAAAGGEYGKINAQMEYDNEGKTIILRLEQETEIGKTYEIFGVVEDNIGNSLTFCVPFTGYNSKIPQIIMTEVQIKYQKGSSKGEVIYRGEYVELLALEDGNLAGLELFSAADGEEKKYDFPAVEVHKGEILLVHLRTIGEGCINEIDDDFNLATAPHSKDGIRDLWSESTVAHFNDSSDIIMLRNSVDGTILDGIMYAAEDADEWKSSVAESALKMYESGIYSSFDISEASCSKGCTPLKSLNRIEASALLEAVLNNDEYDFPVLSDETSWEVMACSPGTL